jgi:cytochrome c-type biogenesis protein CcmF
MHYIGEHSFPGALGHLLVDLSLVSSFVAMIAFFRAASAKDEDGKQRWLRFARWAFILDIISVFSIFGTIYFIISAHYFEYNYAWEHSSRSLSPKYLLACIWEAQEGSFLLWTIWHCVLGIVLMLRAGKWEAPVMTVLSFAQCCLAIMILGIYISGSRIGINPFLLVRQTEAFVNAPIFSRPDYLSIPQMQDGQGLNALLQNYWIVIHPPVLFLGFASTIIPFAFALAGLWKKDYGGWTKTAVPWTLFSAAVLGTGIMMGAAWAYESLTFGGYWAWDPVENASLVPWLVLVAGLHTLVVYNATGHSLRATHLFFILAFTLVLYATFLTRSGILGDNSVHAFVDSGMKLQLILFVAVFLVPAAWLYFKEYRNIPHMIKEESAWSREFWMFIGALVLFLSSSFIGVSTSLPVINSILGTRFTIGEDQGFAYNRIEIFVAIVLGLLTAVTQYLKYRETGRAYFRKRILWPTALALLAAFLTNYWGSIRYEVYGTGFLIAIHLAVFAAWYAIIANLSYIWSGLDGKFKNAGASIAHAGFGILLLGILISSSKKEVLSYNTTGINIDFDPSAKQNPMENITLLKNVRTDMGRYWATYLSRDSVDRASNSTYFQIRLEKKDSSETYDLYPFLMKATKGQQGFAFNPDKHHYWNRDIFSYITAVDNGGSENDTAGFRSYPVSVHDTVFYSRGYIVLDKVLLNPDNERYHFRSTDTALMADLRIISRDSLRFKANPVLYIRDNQFHFTNDTVFSQNLVLALGKTIGPEKIELLVKESPGLVPFISLKVLELPQINLVWLGTLIMILGLGMSAVRRARGLHSHSEKS